MICKKYLKTAHAMIGQKEALFTRLRCKQWDCDACSRMNAQMWREHLNKRLPEIGETFWQLTLTARGDTRGHIESFTSIRDGIDRLIKRIGHVFGKVEYVRVYEKHPDSEAVHAHMIFWGLTPYVANGFSVKHRPMSIGCFNRDGRNGVWSVKTWFKKICPQLGMGEQIDVKEKPVLKAVRYVTKYLTKDLQGLKIRGLRHVQVTKGIGSPPKKGKDLEWETSAYITPYTFPAGTSVLDVNTGVIIDNNYWEVKGFYPDDFDTP